MIYFIEHMKMAPAESRDICSIYIKNRYSRPTSRPVSRCSKASFLTRSTTRYIVWGAISIMYNSNTFALLVNYTSIRVVWPMQKGCNVPMQ